MKQFTILFALLCTLFVTQVNAEGVQLQTTAAKSSVTAVDMNRDEMVVDQVTPQVAETPKAEKQNVATPVKAAQLYVNDAAIDAQLEAATPVAASNAVVADAQKAIDSKNTMGDSQVLAIILCFFLGGWAVHRVYLGSTPLMILWYFLTCGGIFGIVPLIDFFVLIIKGTESFEDSDKFFSW